MEGRLEKMMPPLLVSQDPWNPRKGERSTPRRKPRKKRSRPCRYTPFVVTSLMAALARGESLEEAADAAGIGATTLYRWLALSRAGDARFARLADAVEGARNGSVNSRMVRDHFGGALGKLLSGFESGAR
jgi:hypothetical protein